VVGHAASGHRPLCYRSQTADNSEAPSGMYGQNQLQFMLAEIGAERIIYSEDFPYIIRDNVSDFLEQAELTDDQRTAIAHRNAENVMRIKAT
jgi:predicted TIM-barrel fold metal-dependent hydrolase